MVKVLAIKPPSLQWRWCVFLSLNLENTFYQVETFFVEENLPVKELPHFQLCCEILFHDLYSPFAQCCLFTLLTWGGAPSILSHLAGWSGHCISQPHEHFSATQSLLMPVNALQISPWQYQIGWSPFDIVHILIMKKLLMNHLLLLLNIFVCYIFIILFFLPQLLLEPPSHTTHPTSCS